LDSFPVWAPDAFKEIVVNSVNQYFNQKIYDKEVAARKEEHSEEAIKALVKKRVDELAEEFRNADYSRTGFSVISYSPPILFLLTSK
jgi:hypothetical protein